MQFIQLFVLGRVFVKVNIIYNQLTSRNFQLIGKMFPHANLWNFKQFKFWYIIK